MPPPRWGGDLFSGTPSPSSTTSPRSSLCASADPSSPSRSASFAFPSRCLRRSPALRDPRKVPEVHLVRGVGGGLGVADRLRKGGREGGLAAFVDGDEGVVFDTVRLWDDADEVGVEAVDVEPAHGVPASKDCVAEAAKGVEEGRCAAR